MFSKGFFFRALKSQDNVVKRWPFPKQAPVFMCLQYRSFENFVGKGEIARNEQFRLFPQSFPLSQRTTHHFHQIQNCCLQTLSVWKGLKFVVWERVKPTFSHGPDIYLLTEFIIIFTNVLIFIVTLISIFEYNCIYSFFFSIKLANHDIIFVYNCIYSFFFYP